MNIFRLTGDMSHLLSILLLLLKLRASKSAAGVWTSSSRARLWHREMDLITSTFFPSRTSRFLRHA